MRRPQSAFGLAAVMSSLLVVTLSPASVDAARAPAAPSAVQTFDASGRCTPWRSQVSPPRTIRVLRSKRDKTPWKVAGTVQEVDFRDYVATTMAVEWPEHYPGQTLRAGAIATKQFAWYYVLNWRGGYKRIDGDKVCYDVRDTTVDQYYYPEKYGVGRPRGPGPKILAALDETWSFSLRKFKPSADSSRFFLTGYRAGSSNRCGADANGFKLYHRSTRACGQDGLTWREILRRYLNPNLEIVDPGRHDIIGSKHGDASAMVRNDASQWVARVWTPGRVDPEPGSQAGIKLAIDGLEGFASADMDGDGDDDLVFARKTGNSSARIKVALSNGVVYGDEQTWWDGDTIVPVSDAIFLVCDFQADDRIDVAFLGRGDSAGKSRLVVMRRKPYGNSKSFGAALQWWSGSQDHSTTAAAWAGDVSGDGRADLIIRQNPSGGGVRLRSAVTKSPTPSGNQKMSGLKTRFNAGNLKASKVKMIAADANRDDREDVLMLIGGNGRARIERLQGQSLGGFKRVKLWTAPKSSPIPVEKTRLGVSDVDYDGRTDLILHIDRNGGTRMRVLKTRYDRMQVAQEWQEPFDWRDVRPF
jgi:hypothetical protein